MRNFLTKDSIISDDQQAVDDLTDRQLVCFCVVAARFVLHVWEEEYPEDARPRQAIEAAEQFLYDGESADAAAADATDAAAYAASVAANAAAYAASVAANAAAYAASRDAHTAYTFVSAALAGASWDWLYELYRSIHRGRPFPQEWKYKDTTNIAKTIIQTRDFSGMPILADALEDVGCDDEELLRHLRTDRGLWSVCDWALEGLTS